jgi:hypothetical protein
MKVKKGDRFKDNNDGEILEVSHHDNYYWRCKTIDPGKENMDEDPLMSEGEFDSWEYLGNFVKATQFTDLYEKLNT